ncbi:hypothetical protein RR48_10453 [Papilio machaon]|uniref:Uncharacterized protein n=1 Tax=Papilio machaon TaxID=76193 RepID=A0A194R4T1_PAPMA|nr:hypothetical protein RR48_10453 [Papilio machaon]
MTWSNLRECTGCGRHKTGHCGNRWGRPTSGSGQTQGDNDDDYEEQKRESATPPSLQGPVIKTK